MGAADFLTAVLPSTGLYCICELSSPRKRHLFVDTVASAIAGAEGFAASEFNTFFALASFKEKGSREAANAQFMRSLFVDIDIDPDGDKGLYTSKREAVTALNTFLQETHLDTLGAPWLVDSGGGVHAYWPLTDDVPIDEWKPVAERLKRAAFACSFKIDMKVTADAARVLRVPGTVNYKQPVPRPAVLKNRGATFDLAAIAALLPVGDAPINGHPAISTTLNIPGTRPTVTGATPSTAVALAHHIDSSFDLLLERSLAGTGCQQVKWYYDHAERANMEGLWRAMLSIAKYTDEGIEAGRMLSEWHPYEEARLQKKWVEIKGPYSCGAIESENPGGCDGCPHRGKITNPLKLGWAIPVPAPTPATATTPALPAPPKHFVFEADKVWRINPDPGGKKLLLVVDHTFYLHSVMQEDAHYCARFCKVKNGTTTYIALPTQALASKDETLKHLARQLILPASGSNLHLYTYVCAAVQEASSDDRAVRVPPKYGWQPDNSFAFGERIVSAAGGYTFVSDRLSNLIEGMRPGGDFTQWQRVMTMLCNKGCYDVVTLGLIGFASPLMGWSNNGAEAMVFHACSRESGVGKSLALTLGRSVWGGKRLAVVPKTSENTMLQRAGLLGGLPLYVDEVTSKNRISEMEWIPSFIFDYSQGQHKLKGSSSANAELSDNMTWNGLALITSNSPVLEHMLGARDTSSFGEVQRFLEWRSEKRIDFNDRERDILQLLNENYGHAGPLFAEWLVHNLAAAKQVFIKVLEMWRTQIEANDSERYWVAGGAAIITAATLLGPKHANLCVINVRNVVEFLMGLVANTRRLITSNVITARDLIASFLRDNNGLFVKIGRVGPVAAGLLNNGMNVTLPDSARGRVVGRIEVDVSPGMVGTYIDVVALKKYCSLRNWSYTKLKDDLTQNATVAEKPMDLFKGTQMPPSVTRCLYVGNAAA